MSIDELVEDTGNGNQHLDFLEDYNSNVAEQVEHQILLETIRKYRSRLRPQENRLLTEYYEEGKKDVELAKQYGLSRSNMNEKRHRVLAKLLKTLNQKNFLEW